VAFYRRIERGQRSFVGKVDNRGKIVIGRCSGGGDVIIFGGRNKIVVGRINAEVDSVRANISGDGIDWSGASGSRGEYRIGSYRDIVKRMGDGRSGSRNI